MRQRHRARLQSQSWHPVSPLPPAARCGPYKDYCDVFRVGEIAYSTGDRVKKGAVVGTIGMSGRTSGPHVHIGYGIRSQSAEGTHFGKHNYKLTDPKLFFYREVYMVGLEHQG